ncbi:MAG: ester cyclase [Thermoleophilaceae bacterium]|nr:ester cyclase [Thermoleophilaceae bacterium]
MERLHRALLDSRDPDTVDSFFSPEFESHNNPPGFPPGLAGVKQFFAMFGEAFPDAEVTIDDLVAEGDRVAVATTLTGTHQGQVMGVAPTGRRVAVTGIDLLRIEHGKIVEHRGLTDTVGLMRQLAG